MEVSATNTSNLAQSATGGAFGAEMGRDMFLQLLLVQLSHQDPLSPMTNEEFIAQLATFTSLERLEGIEALLEANLAFQQSSINQAAVSLIGKDVAAATNVLTLTGEEDPSLRIGYDISGTHEASIKIYNEQGDIVRVEFFGPQSGHHEFVWDGKDDDGNLLPAGEYLFEVSSSVDDEGMVTRFPTTLIGRVESVDFTQGYTRLLVDGSWVDLSSVISVSEGEPSRNTDSV